MKRSAHQVLDVTKANFRYENDVLLSWTVVLCSSVLCCRLCFHFSTLSVSPIVCVFVYIFWTSLFSVCVLPLQSTLQGFTPFSVSDLSLSNRMHAARTEYLQGENMNLFSSFTFAPFCIPTSLCKCMHTISLLHRSDSSFTIQSDHHFQFICTCLQLYIRCIFRPFDAINCRPLHNKLMKF